MVLGHKHFRHHRVLDALTDLIANEFGVGLVGIPRDHDVTEIGQEFLETRLRPQLFELRQPFFR